MGNTLDLISTNSPERIDEVSITAVDSSDHYLITFAVKTRGRAPKCSKSYISSFKYSEANWVDLDCYLMDADFSSFAATANVNNACEFLNETVNYACHMYIPEVLISSNPSPVWFNGEIRHNLNVIRSLKRRLQKKHSSSVSSKIPSLSDSVEKQICSAKESYIATITAAFSTNPKKLFRYLKRPTQVNYFQDFCWDIW